MQKRISIITLIVVVVLCCLATFMTTFLVLHNEKEADIVDEYVSTGTTESEAARMAKEIVPYLKEDCVDAVIMVST